MIAIAINPVSSFLNWGFIHGEDLNNKLVWYSNGLKQYDHRMVLYLSIPIVLVLHSPLTSQLNSKKRGGAPDTKNPDLYF